MPYQCARSCRRVGMSSILAIAGGGLQDATRRFDTAAARITSGFAVQTPSAAPPGNDPAAEARIDALILGLSQEQVVAVAFRANLAVLRTADETVGSLLDIAG